MPEDYGFNVEWNLAGDMATALEAKLEAMKRALVWCYFDGRSDLTYEAEFKKVLSEALAAQQEQEDE
mgnify:FL=1